MTQLILCQEKQNIGFQLYKSARTTSSNKLPNQKDFGAAIKGAAAPPYLSPSLSLSGQGNANK